MARQHKNDPVNRAITPQASPAMDRPSIAFAWFLDSMVIGCMEDENGHRLNDDLVLLCTLCGDEVCEVEDGDSLRILLNTALAHDC